MADLAPVTRGDRPNAPEGPMERAAWRGTLIRIQTWIDSADDDATARFVDFAIAELREAGRSGQPLAQAIGTGADLDRALAWYGLERFTAQILTTPALQAEDPIAVRLRQARAVSDKRSWVERSRIRRGWAKDDQAAIIATAQAHLESRTAIKAADPVAGLAWTIYTLQALQDVARDAGDADDLLRELVLAGPPDRIGLDGEALTALIDDAARLDSASLATSRRRLKRWRRTP